jgi:LPS export ABC transporter protein LptC
VEFDTVMSLWRRIMLWAVPAVLLAALGWTFVPHGPVPPGGARRPPAASYAPHPAGAPADASKTLTGLGAAPGAPPSHRGSGPAATSPAATPHPADGVRSGGPAGEIRAGTFVGTDEAGHTRWRITADDVLLGEGRQTVVLRNVRATFYDPRGAMTVTGASGRYDTRSREVDMEGDVHGVSSNGRQIYADALHYSPTSASVSGNGHVRVIQERVIMYADHMVSNTTLGQTRFFGNVHMTVR